MNTGGRLAVIIAVGAVAIGVTGWATGFEWETWDRIGQPRNVLEIDGAQVRVPLPEGEATRLAAQVPVDSQGQYAFMFEEPDQGPTRYDPCRPLRWVHNTQGMPEGAEDMIHAAVADISRHTGLVFEYEGTTDEVADFDRPLFQDRYGEAFAPIIVGWGTAAQVPDLADSVMGLGGSSSVSGAYGNQRYLESGAMILDAEDFTTMLGSNRGEALAAAVVMHELAHVVGLAHVEDNTELMHGENVMLVTWGPGDRAGLAIAGAGPCQE
ncbi:peptidase [Demequina sp.]|uniref:peptidase n=1 Tax=Demequina sp. TaxID=2050685 RepID=UPI003A873367